jgi:HEAT repeat protein
LAHFDVEVVKSSLQMLANESDLRASAHLGACLDHEAWDVRRLAADLLGKIGGEVAHGLLRTKLSIETEPLVREALLRALGEVDMVSYVRRNTPGIDPGSWRPR